jgi:hypothetical protein
VASIEGYKVVIVLRGTATGDSRAVLNAKGRAHLLAEPRHRWKDAVADFRFFSPRLLR